MNGLVRRGALVFILMLSAGCGDSAPSSPTRTTLPPTAPPAPPSATNFPPLAGPSRTFTFDHALSYRVSGYTTQSRVLLYDNGAFVLQYDSLGGGYRGGYDETTGVIVFRWEGWSSAGPWGATGTLTGDLLTVQYNLVMQMTDFEDAVYALKP
jgi:hypothetical protein